MADKVREDFDNTIKACRTNFEVFETCLGYVRHATKVITKGNIGEVEKRLENHNESVMIRNLEKSLKKLLDIGMKHVYHYTSKILDEIQPGKICLLKRVTYVLIVYFYLLLI